MILILASLRDRLILFANLDSSLRSYSQVCKEARGRISSISSDENSSQSFQIRQHHAVYILPATENIIIMKQIMVIIIIIISP